MTRLVHQAALQERAANVDTRRGSCGSLYGCDHYDESRACKVIKELQKGGACKLEFQDVDQALEVVNRQISSVLKVTTLRKRTIPDATSLCRFCCRNSDTILNPLTCRRAQRHAIHQIYHLNIGARTRNGSSGQYILKYLEGAHTGSFVRNSDSPVWCMSDSDSRTEPLLAVRNVEAWGRSPGVCSGSSSHVLAEDT